MSGTLLIGMTGVLVAVISVVVSWIAFRHTREKDTSEENTALIRGIVKDLLTPVEHLAKSTEAEIRKLAPALERDGSQVTAHDTRIGALEIRLEQLRADVGKLSAMSDRIGVLETKIDVFWKNVAYDAARIIHSPHPERAELDSLLERFGDDALGLADLARMAQLLGEILHNHDSSSGERISAAILLRVLEQKADAS